MGPEEWERSRKGATNSSEPDFAGLVPAMKEAWEEVKAGKGEPAPAILPNRPELIGGKQ